MSVYYVGPGGNDSNPGQNWSNRLLTLNGAEDLPLQPGDTVYVGPGIYGEPQLVMKPYVTILGFFQTQCIVLSIDHTKPLIVGAGYAAIDRITLSVYNPAAPPPYLIEYMGNPEGVHFRADNVVLNSTGNLVHVGSTNGPNIFLLNSCFRTYSN